MTAGKQKKIMAGVIGWPVKHSMSPRLHRYWLDKYGINGAYNALPVAPENLQQALRRFADDGYGGLNVTVPHKQAVFNLVDDVSATARRMGAVNTVIMENGRLKGDNTDAFGFIENLKSGQPGWPAEDGPAVVLGAGGAARAVVSALIDHGAPQIRLLNRTRQRAEKLAADIAGPVEVIDWGDRGEALNDAALLVNTTVLGMAGQPELQIELRRLPLEALVSDIVYRPLQTGLLAAAAKRGNRTVDGLGMLLHQARPGFAAWFGVEPSVDGDLRRHVLAGLGEY